jgi:hypothetical protein
MHLHRVVLEWAGTAVIGRAVTVLHYDATEDPAPPVAAIKSALTASAALFPSGMNITVPNSGDTIDDADGELTGVWTSSGGGTVGGTTVGVTVLGVGACITWHTGAIVDGRRLRGRTFLVPLAATVWEANGTFSAGALASLKVLSDALMATGGLGVWHRPTTPGGIDGTSSSVLSNTITDKPAILTSRRD